MFRQFFDTSFNDYRQVRVVVQELLHDELKESSADFQRFCTSLFDHKSYTYEQFKIEYCFVKESLIIAETSLNEIQLYRRPFAFIFFTVCDTSEQLRIVLDEYTKIKQREKGVYIHLFVQYRTINSQDQDEISNDGKLINGTNDESDYVLSPRPSISSVATIDYYQSLPHPLAPFKLPDSISSDDSGGMPSDHASLTDSLNGTQAFHPITTDTPDGDDEEANVSLGINTKLSNDPIKTSKVSLFKDKKIPTTNLFDSFDSDLTRVLRRLENDLSKYTVESKGFDTFVYSIDSQLADIRLMISCEKDCSLLENQGKYRHGFVNNRIFKSVLNEFDMRVMLILFNQYVKANVNLGIESGKNKLPKKLIDSRTIKRKGDCCLLLGAIEKAYQDYRRVADVLKSQNDLIWHAAALEARIAASYASTQKPKRQMQRTMSFLRQNSLTRRLSVERYFNRSNTPLNLREKMELALQIYGTANRSQFNKITFQLELDACLRWCSLLWEQNDVEGYRDEIDQYITRINRLGSYLDEHIDSIYLNAYLAETYAFIGLKRKSALYYRSAAFSGLTLLSEEESYNDEINFFDELIKRARTGYGIDDNQLIFPLIQKTIINESIQISLRNDDFTTIIENVHFAIESLIEHMTDLELKALLTFLNASEESIACSYCSIPRLKSLDLLPLSNRLKAWKAEPKNSIFIYHAKRALPIQQQSLHRKVDFFWVKNEQAQIILEVENYLPATMSIDQLEFLTEIPNQLFTKLDTKYQISSRTTKRLTIDCIPKETGQIRIQGLRYHIWSTNQEFRFGDFPTIRHCSCSVDVVDELPILDVKYLLINDTNIALSNISTIYNAQIHRGEDVFVTLGLINSSIECAINTLEIQAFVSGSNMTEYIKVTQLDLPILIGKTIQLKIDVTEIYDRCLSRQDRSILNKEVLTIEFRLNYSNELINTNGYYRQNTIELCLNYFSSVTVQINDIQNNEDDLSYLMCCTIDNHLSEGILFENNIINPSESSLISLKQDKIKLNPFPSDLNQLITEIRTQLPTHIHYKTINSNKQLRLPIDFQYFSKEKIEKHSNVLIQSPYRCYWHFQRIVNTLQIHLCVLSKSEQILKLEFLFPSSNNIRFLNSNKIIFNNIKPGEYLMAERILVFSQENNFDKLVVDVNVNNITWKRITLTLPNEQFEIMS